MRKITDVGCESNSIFSDRYACMLSCLYATPWTVAWQTSLSMGFSRQEYWNGLLCLPPGDLPDPGIEPMSLMSAALARRFVAASASWEALTEVH